MITGSVVVSYPRHTECSSLTKTISLKETPLNSRLDHGD